ncbi:hypothetical protein A8C56_13080 [Niabella ginsenosidivorans]|uniref:DUF2961 domain-containing protein n=1 Tax=Niabella ginsenosidivorans TaxID=1176587 RepID=A0A1A9I546_9BACT|nr:glycoside hydrolase family 172 protein [Niabella ginsenosidivorans]ANH81791.1 hypothetical protein A8C56_13080 [Niabella ginsenosidivorans]
MKSFKTGNFCISLLMIVQGLFVHAQTVVTFESELERLSDLKALSRYLEGSLVRQVSSYDTTGGNDDGFGGNYSYLRKEPAGGLVIFDQKGQGVIERIWTPTPTDDTLDFYFDGSRFPGLSIKFRDLFSNSVAPFLAPVADHKVGGFYSYIPVPYKSGCKIVFRGKKMLFYQIQYREYDKRYQVQTFKKQYSARAQQLLGKAIEQWNNEDRSVSSCYAESPRILVKNIRLVPGSTSRLFDLQEGGRILGIELKPPGIFSGMYKQVDLKITWDDEPVPAVYVPVADFFGFAYGTPSMKSLFLGAANAKAYCYIPMPFDKNAKAELIYRAGAGDEKSVNITATIYYSNEKRNAAKEGRFYAYWKQERPAAGKPFVFLQGQGKGQYIGTLFQGQATDGTNFTEYFEGDDSTAIDGQMTAHGTGSEDYFNGGWYAQPGGWAQRLGAPLSGCLEYSLPLGRTGGYRFFLMDKMPFYKSIFHSIEHGPVGNNRPVNYTSVAMYYADQSIAAPVPPTTALTRVYEPDTLTFYTRLMRHLTYNGNLQFKNGVAVLAEKNNASLTINVAEIPKGEYKVYLHQVSAATGAIQVQMADALKVHDWNKLAVNKGNEPQNLLIGDVAVTDNFIPVSVLFKSAEKNPGFVFDRVLFIKK